MTNKPTNEITPELIKELYDNDPSSSDGWEIAANIINKLVPRADYASEAAYFFHIKEVWNMVQEYIDSTYITE